MRPKPSQFLVLIAFLFLTTVVKSQQNLPVPLDPMVRFGKLKNGFTYYIRKNSTPEKRAYFYLATKAGSILEQDDQQGLAHFIEHMGFNGTAHFPKNELINYLQKSGVRLGPDLNAFTNYDETVYKLPVPTDDKEVYDNAFQIIRDWAQEATMDSLEIEKERGIVLEELRLRKTALERNREKYSKVLFRNSLYPQRSPIGKEDIISSFSIGALKRFYADWYRPNLQALIVVGDIDVVEAEAKIKKLFRDLKNPEKERERIKSSISLNGTNSFLAINDKENTATTALIYIKHLVMPQETEADYINLMARNIINQMLSERFRLLSREADPGFKAAGSSINFLTANLDAFYLAITPKEGQLEKGFKSGWREIVKIKRFGFTEEEFLLQKNKYRGSRAYLLRERDKTSSQNYVEAYTQHFLKQRAAPGIEQEMRYIARYLNHIKLSDINNFYNQYVSNFNRDIFLTAPEHVVLPSREVVEKWMEEVEAEELKPTEGVTIEKDLLAKKPVKGKIVSEKEIKEAGVTELVLGNGLKVVLKPTNFKNDIIFSGVSSGGTSVYSDSDYPSAYLAESILLASGVGSFSAVDLRNYLLKNPVNVVPFVREKTQGFTGGCLEARIETALQLIHLYFTDPRKDSLIFKSQVEKYSEFLRTRGNSPARVFSDSVNAVMTNYSNRFRSLTEQELSTVELDKVQKIIKERFSDASAFTFTFVGDFSVNRLKPLIEQYLGSLPATHKDEKSRSRYKQPLGIIKKTIARGQDSRASVQLVFSGELEKSEYEELKLDALVSILKIRLMEKLREEDAGVYTVNTRSSTSQGLGRFTIDFTCAPANVGKMISEANDVVRELTMAGPGALNINKYQAEFRRQTELKLKTNQFWVSYLESQCRKNKPYDEVFSHTSIVDSMTSEDLKISAQRYLSGRNYLEFILLPEK
ncbi:M16 family metallopeptidase [Desertivirga brevis]|uniref:M16 family metallopeptidase n=1 Tax=Desertivirga brevis TaxID=2810310 RepID=UPI001A970098|nr:insulinase family protein [Pedobacter sp. SYSU D00873]